MLNIYRSIVVTLCIFASLLSTSVSAEEIFALTQSGKLLRFDSSTPGTIISSQSVTGLNPSDSLVGIDFRPSTGDLFGLGTQSLIYKIDPSSAVSTAVGSGFTPAKSGTAFGVDFNPTVDRLRLVSDAAQNLRLNPLTGLVAGTDTNLAYSAFDSASGLTPHVVSVAYTNNTASANSTTLYAIDSTRDALIRIGGANSSPSPNGGSLFTIASLGVDTSDTVGFDISGLTSIAYVALTLSGATTSGLYEINLVTGDLTLLGTIGGSEKVLDISLPTTPVTTIWGASTSALTRLTAEAPSISTSSLTVTGLQGGETILGIDFRPANGALYLLGSTSRLYTVDLSTGAATQVGTAGAFTLNGTSFGFDFNPVPDRIRVVSDNDQNLRLNPNNGTLAAADTVLAYGAGDVNFGMNPNIVAAAYTNNFAGATSTSLYSLDSNLSILALINPPNNGTLATIGALGTAFNTSSGLDIGNSTSLGYANSANTLFLISLATGTTLNIGTMTAGVTDIAIAPTSTFQFSAATTSVREGDGTASLTVTRTGNTAGTAYLSYSTTAGTATSSDFTAASDTLTFVSGETSKTITIPITDDSLLESSETFITTLSEVNGGSLGTSATNTITIIDSDLSGTIVDSNGAGVAGITVSDGTRSATTDANGNYILQNLPNGSFTITPILSGRVFSPASRSVTVADAVTSANNFTLLGTANDIDGDGFPNEVEAKFGTNPNDPASTPFNGSGPGTAKAITKPRLNIELNFKKDNRDSMTFTGVLPIAKTFQPSGKSLVVDIGGVAKGVTLSKKGSGSSSGVSASLSTLGKNKLLTVRLKNGDFENSLTDEGLVNQTTKGSKTVVINVYVDGVLYTVTRSGKYTGKLDQSGSFK